MRLIYVLVAIQLLLLLVVVVDYHTFDKEKKYTEISLLSEKLQHIFLSTQFKSTNYKEFVYE